MLFSYKFKNLHTCMMSNTSMSSYMWRKVQQQYEFKILIHELIKDIHYPTEHTNRQSSQFEDSRGTILKFLI
jgi:hypothetical protein